MPVHKGESQRCMKPRLSRSLRRILAGIVVCGQLASADSLDWNGTTADHSWNTTTGNTNWQKDGTASSFAEGDDVTFGIIRSGDPSSTVEIASDLTAGDIQVNDAYTFDVTADSTLTGAITGNGSINKTGTGNLTIASSGATSGVGLSVNQGQMTLDGTAAYRGLTAADGTTLTIANGADITVTGAALSTTGNTSSLVVDGKLSLEEAATVGGSMSVADSGTLVLNGQNALDVTGTLTLASGSTVDVSAFRPTLSGADTTFTLATTGGAVSVTGVRLTGPTFDSELYGAKLVSNGNNLDLVIRVLHAQYWAGGTGNWNNDENNNVWSAQQGGTASEAYLPGAPTTFSGGTAAVTVTDAVSTSTMTVSNGNYTFSEGADGSLTVSQKLLVTDNARADFQQAPDLYTADVQVDQGSSLTVGEDVLMGSLTNAGTATFDGALTTGRVENNGSLAINADSTIGTLSGNGALRVGTGSTLALNSGAVINTLDSAGTITTAQGITLLNTTANGGSVTAQSVSLAGGDQFTSLTTGQLTLRGALTQTAPQVTTEQLSGMNQTMSVTLGQLVRGSGDYTLVEANALDGNTRYTLSADTLEKFLDSGYRATLLNQDNKLVMNLETADVNYFGRNTTTGNGYAGATMLDAAFDQLDPQANREKYPDLAAVMDALDVYIASGNTGAAEALSASVAGAGVTALNTAWRGQMERQLRSIRNRTTTMDGGMPCYPPDPKAPHVEQPRFLVWANAEIDYQNLRDDDATPGYKLNSIGGTAGFAARTCEELTLGAAFTGMSGRLSSKGYGSNASGDLDAYYANVFARYSPGCWTHTLVGTAGWADAKLKRGVTFADGGYSTSGDTDGLGFGVMYEVGRTFKMGDTYFTNAWWQPVLNVAYIHSEMDGYTESGSDAALRVGKQEFDNVVFGLGARMQAELGHKLFNRTASVEMRVLGKAMAGDRRGEADVSLIDAVRTTKVRGSEPGAFGVEVGIGLSMPLGLHGGTIFADCSAEFRDNLNTVNGVLGYSLDF